MTDLVEVARFAEPVGADLAKAYLESYGVESVVFDENAARYLAAFGVRLMVLQTDENEARRLLQDYFKANEQSGSDRSPPE
ncbi:MAG: DUF2007 domain-containing protein [Bacillota bacterium]